MIPVTNHKSFSVGTKKFLDLMFSLFELDEYIGQFKEEGVNIVQLTKLISAFKMENPDNTFSIRACANWANQPEILEYFNLEAFNQQTLYRCIRIIGDNFETLLKFLEKEVFTHIQTTSSPVFVDWTTNILWGLHASLGAYGHSKAKRTDKQQVTLGAALIGKPYCIPIGLTLKAGNINDMTHFQSTLVQIAKELGKGTIVAFDKGAYSQPNFDLVESLGLQYLTSMKFNKTLDGYIKKYWDAGAVCINPDAKKETKKIYALTIKYPSRTDFLFYSKERYDHDVAMIRKDVCKKYGLTNKYGEIKKKKKDGTIQTKIIEYEDVKEQIEAQIASNLTGREGFFTLTTDADLTAAEALQIYREKDAIEKFFQTMKREMNLEPLRVRRNDAMKGIIFITYLIQLFMAIVKYLIPDCAKKSVKSIIKELSHLTVTIVYKGERGSTTSIISNFTPTNTNILNFDYEKSWVKAPG